MRVYELFRIYREKWLSLFLLDAVNIITEVPQKNLVLILIWRTKRVQKKLLNNRSKLRVFKAANWILEITKKVTASELINYLSWLIIENENVSSGLLIAIN